MSNLVQIGETCQGLGPIVRVIRDGLFPLVQIGIPILLIVYGTIDLGKAVIASDEKDVKAAQGRLIKRFIYAAAVFFIVTLVSILMNIVAAGASDEDKGAENTDGWWSCWHNAVVERVSGIR